jgi:hypothetical protein
MQLVVNGLQDIQECWIDPTRHRKNRLTWPPSFILLKHGDVPEPEGRTCVTFLVVGVEGWSVAPAVRIPTAGCRAPCERLPPRKAIFRTDPTCDCADAFVASLRTPSPTGRATTVPFTVVLTGPQRTTTDNARAGSTCTVLRLRRWRCRPNWLCKQVVS